MSIPIPERRRRGRPPVDEDDDSTSVHLVLPSRQYDELYERARRKRETVQEFIRRELDRPPNKKT